MAQIREKPYAINDRPFVLVGGGGHAKVLASILTASGFKLAGFVDNNPNALLSNLGIKYLGTDHNISNSGADFYFVNGIGSTGSADLRRKIFESLTSAGLIFPALVHPFSWRDSGVAIDEGSQIMAGVVVQAGTVIGANVIINTGATIDHDCIIGEHVHVAPGCTLSGNVNVGAGVHIGTGAKIIEGIKIGSGALIGAGAVVTRNVDSGTVVTGVPARVRS